MHYTKQTFPVLDHIHYSSLGISFKLPPKKDPEELNIFDVTQTAQEKIETLIQRLDELETNFDKNTLFIHANTSSDPNDFSREFYITIESYIASEMYYVREWIKYWYSFIQETKPKTVLQNEKGGFTDEQIVEARNVPLESLFSGDLRSVGGRLLGLCPFHDEKTPSFSIFPDNHYYCFGCHESGNPIDFLMKTKNITFPQAVEELL